MGSDGTTLTLLHRAILLNDTAAACFLIRKGADVNSPSRPGAGDESSGRGLMKGVFSPPLHMACERGLQEVVQCLVEHHADVNAKVSQPSDGPICVTSGKLSSVEFLPY